MQDKLEIFTAYNNRTHLIGRISTFIVLVLLVASPFMMGAALHTAPDMSAFFLAIAQILLIYIPSCIVEFLIYTPMLGASGSYLAFMTGNLINLKIPCAINACGVADTKVGTPENEIVSALSISTSALVTTAVIALGVLLMIPLQPVLSSPVLKPAFDNVVPALFGAMAYRYFRKNMVVAALPLIVMTALLVAVPSLSSSIGFLIIPSGAIAIAVAWLRYKKQNAKEA